MSLPKLLRRRRRREAKNEIPIEHDDRTKVPGLCTILSDSG
jgi:hypothetical protein